MDWINRPYGKEIDGKIVKQQGGQARHAEDWTRFRHGREHMEGFNISNYLQAPPLFFTRDRHTLWIGDIYRGASAFLILSGPSFLSLNHDLLRQPGILTMGVNNSVKTFRPNLWCSVDNPQNFIKSIWLDPQIVKFVPHSHAEKRIFDNESWREMNKVVGDCPSVVFYHRNGHFQHEQFLTEDTINWGCEKDKTGSCGFRGCRSVMLASVRILFALGVRNLFLCGADFKMEKGAQNYSFDQGRTDGSIKNNNNTYNALNKRFDLLRPIFEKYEFRVYNTYEQSGLKSFPYVPFEQAIEFALDGMPDIATERTEGLYDRQAKEEEQKKEFAEKKARGNPVAQTLDDFLAYLRHKEQHGK